MLALLAAWACAEPPAPRAAYGATWEEGLAFVDWLAVDASPRRIAALRAEAWRPGAIFSASWRDGWEDEASALAGAPIYAVEVTLAEDSATVDLREALLWTNRGPAPVTEVALRVAPLGSEGAQVGALRASIGGVPVEARREGGLLVVPVPGGVDVGAAARILVVLEDLVVPPFADEDAYVDALDVVATGAFGRADGVVNLGYLLPQATGLLSDGRQDRRPMPTMGEHTWFDPSLFHVVVDVPEGLQVAVSGVELERRSVGGRSVSRGVAAGMRELGLEVGDWRVVERDAGGVRLRVHGRRSDPALADDVLGYAASALATFEALWGPLPYRELDLVDAPIELASGLEFPGLATLDVVDGGARVAADEIRWTVAHELAHQWWYAEVGSDPRVEPWLDEGLASQAALLHEVAVRGPGARDALVRSSWVDPYDDVREGGVIVPAAGPAESFDLSQYSVLVYGKAPLFLEQVRLAIGDAAYHAALRDYRAAFRLRSARGEDLLAALRGRSPDPTVVDDLYRRWMVEVRHLDELGIRPPP